MKRRPKKLALTKETLRQLAGGYVKPIGAGDCVSIQSGETNCWCSDSCNGCSGALEVGGIWQR